MKICVLVKEVPDAAVEKRINPGTGRLTAAAKDLNPFSPTRSSAMQLKEGGAIEVDEASRHSARSRVRALHKPSRSRRPLAAPSDGGSRLGCQRHGQALAPLD